MESATTTSGNVPRAAERLRYHPGGWAFGLILFTMLLPWLTFSYNCTETTGRQSGYDLLASHDVRLSKDIDTTGGTSRESRTIRISGQWEVRLIVLLIVAGLALTLVQGLIGSLVRGSIALTGAILTAIWTESAEALDREWVSNDSSRWNPYSAEADYGAFLTIYFFLLVALLNFSLPKGASRTSTSKYIADGIFYMMGALGLTIVFAITFGVIANLG